MAAEIAPQPVPPLGTPQKIIFLGDSITGWSDLSRWLKYSHIIDCMIEARCGAGQAIVLNRGVGGDTTGMALARLDTDVISEKPDVVVLLITGNDTFQHLARGVIDADLDQLIKRITAVCPRVLMMQYHNDTPDSPGPLIIREAAARWKLPLLDMAVFLEAARDDSVPANEPDYHKLSTWRGLSRYRTSDLLGPDGVHLNSAGEIMYAKAIFAKLRELNWLPPAHS